MIHAIAPHPMPECPPDPRGLGGLMLLVGRAERPLPLADVKVRAEILGPFCRTVVEQHFVNGSDQPMEAIHIFPLPEDGAVVEMELRAGEVVVRAECKEKKEAEADFAAARQAGHRAGLLSAERADVHTLRVTNLPPHTDVRVRIVVVEQLSAADGKLRWRFPTVVAPRYMPGQGIGHSGPGVATDTDVVPDASRISPPLRLSGGTKLDLEVQIAGPVRSLESSLHALRLDLDEGGVRVAPSATATLNKDFILNFSTADEQHAVSRAWTDGQYTALFVEAPSVAQMPAMPRDAVFVVDISGSMGGTKMDAAKKALVTALHGLLPGDRFRLIAFDDQVEAMSAEFLTYTNGSLKQADAWVARLQARGGTEMLPAIQAALDGSTPAGRLRTVLFITDGQAGDEDRLAAAVSNRRNGARFFTLGIDTAVNGALMKQLARLGGGTCELCTPTDDIEAVVAKLESRFGSPLLTGITAQGAVAARPEEAVLFSGRPLSMLLEGAGPVQLSGLQAGGSWSETVLPRRVSNNLGPLWARERIAYLQDRLALRPFEEEAIKPEILRISLLHGVLSRFTAMVAVDRSVKVQGAPVAVVQPVELPDAWEQEHIIPGMAAPSGGGGVHIKASLPLLSRSAPQTRPTAARSSASAGHWRAPLTDSPEGSPVEFGRAEADLAEDDDAVFESLAAMPPAPRAPAAKPTASISKLEADAPRRKKSSPGILDRMKEALGLGEKSAKVAPAEEEADLQSVAASPPPPPPAAPASAPKAALLPESALAAAQSADGSYGGDLRRSGAALLLLLWWGHTRRKGLRSRTVGKLAIWLATRSEPLATELLDILAAAERGEALAPSATWEALFDAGPEGAALRQALGR